MEKFALIPLTQMENPNFWVCHYLSSNLEDILELESQCYPPSSIEISKYDASGVLLENYLLKIKSCLTGRRKKFVIFKLTINDDFNTFFKLT